MGNCLGQFAAFLVYDIVLIPRYLQHWPKTHGGFRISLEVYLSVLFCSALLAIWMWWKHLSDRGRRT